MAARFAAWPLALLVVAAAVLSALAAPAAADTAAIGATISIDQTALTASLYGAQGDVRVALAGTVHIASERGHFVNLELSVVGGPWASAVNPASLPPVQTDADVRFSAWVDVPPGTADGPYSLAVRGVDSDDLFPIDTKADFTVSVFHGPLALTALLNSSLPRPGQTAEWSVALTNLASFDLDYDIAFTAPAGFSDRPLLPPVQILDPGATTNITFRLTAPPGAAPGPYAWSVAVASSSHPEVSASLTAPFTVVAPLPPPAAGSPDFIAEHAWAIGFGAVAVGIALFFSATEVGYLALAFSLFVPLFSRLKRENVLDNFTRGQIYGYVQANPGAHYSAIQQVLDIENGVLAYHLRVLLREGYVVARSEGVFKRFYPRDYRIPKRRTLLTRLQVDILAAVEAAPGVSQRELARLLGESKQVISYNVGALREGGLLEGERRGRDVLLRPAAQGASPPSAPSGPSPPDDEAPPAGGPSDSAPL